MIDQTPISFPPSVKGHRRLFIGGAWRPAVSDQEIDVINPATGARLCTIARGGARDIDLAVGAARKAFEGDWSRWSPYERQKLLIRINDLIEQHFDELALIDTLDMGAPITRTRSLKTWVSQAILYYASQTGAATAQTLQNSLPGNFSTMKLRGPVGVVGGIIPWNAPLISQWWILGPVLATGCTAVMKPAEDASLSTLRTMELLQEAGVPDGVLNLVTGYGSEAGSALAEHRDVDRIAFTGSMETARKIISASAGNMKRLSLELGGKSPDIVFADADMDKAVPGAAMACFTNSGQICAAGTRLFVQRSIHDEFVERLKDFTGKLRVGDSLDPDTQLGPLVSEKQLERVLHYVDIGREEGASIAIGGGRIGGALAGGYFVEPTLFADTNNSMTVAREEIFGPVISLIPFDDEAEALALANDTHYGLAGGLWTQSLATANRMATGIKAGTLWINCYGPLDPAVGFGGYKMSGYGWKGSQEQIESYLYTKAVYTNLG